MTTQVTGARRLTSIDAAAKYADVCSRTIRRRIAEGSLNGYRIGPKLIRVDLDELDTMLLASIIPTVGGERHGPAR